MAYAKLSASLLACNDEWPPTTLPQNIPVPSIAPTPAAWDGRTRLAQHLKTLKLAAFLSEHDTLARQCAAEGLNHTGYLLRLAELELAEREQRTIERRIKGARFPAVKRLDSFDFAAVTPPDKSLVLELGQCEYVARRENIIVAGNDGTGKTHLAVALGLAACEKGLTVRFTTAASLVHELLGKRGEPGLIRLQRRLAAYKVLIINELGYVPLSAAGAKLLFEVISDRSERGSTIITSNLPLDQWGGVFGSEQLADALLDRLTKRVHFLAMTGGNYRLN
jgi:DNA replication protein DnaC